MNNNNKIQFENLTPFKKMLVGSVAICTVGFLLTITIVLWFIGIPMMMLGAAMFILTIIVKVILSVVQLFNKGKNSLGIR